MELGNNGVMKFPGEASERIARLLLSGGPATAGELASTLGMSATAVRRPLQALVGAHFVAESDQPPYGPSRVTRRGRPSRIFSLTDLGRSACDQSSDDLALEALRYMQLTGGPGAVMAFAVSRARRLFRTSHDSASIRENPSSLADLLTAEGFAATIEPNDAGSQQLCQHLCPVVDAAREFPQLCEAESEVLSEVLGVHVTRLSTLARGGHVCTTLIPQLNDATKASRSLHQVQSTRKVSA